MSRQRWSRERVVAAILDRHRQGLPLANIHHHDRRLCAAGIRYYGNWRAAMHAAGLSCRRRLWSPQGVIAAIQTWQQRQMPMTRIWKEDRSLFHAARWHFGGWRKALLAAGVQPKPPWTTARVIADLQDFHRRGLPLSNAWKTTALYERAKHFFGTWRKAIQAAGLPLALRRTWTRQEVLDAIRERHRHGLRTVGVWRDNPSLFVAATRCCGSWRNALREAGLPLPPGPKWTKETVVAAIQARYREGRSLLGVWRDDKPLVSAAFRHFGNWHKALHAAGFPSKPRRWWSKERVIRELHVWHRQAETRISIVDASLAKSAVQYFGSLAKAWEAAGIEVQPRCWTQQRVVAAIQDRYVQGLPKQFAGFRDRQLAYAARKCFGGWAAAVAAAGLSCKLPSRKPRGTWTRQAIIEAIQGWAQKGLPLTKVWKEDKLLYVAAQNRFGNWYLALQAAGLKLVRTEWTKACVVEEIQTWHQRGVKTSRISVQDARLRTAGIQLFGRWKKALAAAGLQANPNGRKRPRPAKASHKPRPSALKKRGISRVTETRTTVCRAKK